MAKIICLSCFKELSELENVFSCEKRHHYCAACGKSMHLQCECYESLHLLTLKNAEENPDAIDCLGNLNLLNIWECNWSGRKDEFHEHFIRSHNTIEIFSQFQVSSVPFRSDQLLSAMTLVRAFDSTFIFYYHTNPSAKMIYFLIFLLDGDEQPKPESFLYELMIKSPRENHCKIKFVEKCYVFADDIKKIRDDELCAAISYRTIQKHLFDDHIHFSFLIKKNCKESLSVGSLPGAANKDHHKPKHAAHAFANKGSMRSNNVTKGQSIPDIKLSGGGVAKKEVIAVEIEETKGSNKNPPDYSSINKFNNNKQFASPVHGTEAMKRNDDELIQQGVPRTDECYHIPSNCVQAYKNPDHKIYKQKYNPSCLGKPILKK